MSNKTKKPLEDMGEQSLPQLRERIEPNTSEGSQPWWLFLIIVFFAAVAFAYIGSNAGSFSNDQLTQKNYVPVGYQGGAGEQVERTPLEEKMALGEELFSTCAGCHGTNGGGGTGPPLDGSEWISGPTQRFGMIILNGLDGPIEVMGQMYNGNMSAQPGMDARKLSAVMTYVRVRFGDDSLIEPKHLVVSDEVAANIIEASEQRDGGQFSAPELEAEHSVYTEGQLLDPETGEPVS